MAVPGSRAESVKVLRTDTRPHFRDNVATPSVAAGANNGASPPAPALVAGSNDVRGLLNFGSGTGIAAGAQCVLTFSRAYDVAPTVQLCPQSGPAASVTYYVQTTTTGFTINAVSGLSASQAAGTYAFQYLVID